MHIYIYIYTHTHIHMVCDLAHGSVVRPQVPELALQVLAAIIDTNIYYTNIYIYIYICICITK